MAARAGRTGRGARAGPRQRPGVARRAGAALPASTAHASLSIYDPRRPGDARLSEARLGETGLRLDLEELAADLGPQFVARMTDLATVAPESSAPSQFVAKSYEVLRREPDGRSVRVPRYFARDVLGLPVPSSAADPRWAFAPVPDAPDRGGRAARMAFAPGESLRDSQREPVEAFLAAATGPAPSGGVLVMQTGDGKTTVAVHLACRLAARTLVLVHKLVLAEQWAQRIARFAPGAVVQSVSSAHIRDGARVPVDPGADFVICTIQTLACGAPGPPLCGFDLVVVDEAHHVAADKFNGAMFRAAAPLTLGLTASLERADRAHRVVEWHMGPVLFRRDPVYPPTDVLVATWWRMVPISRNAQGNADVHAIVRSIAGDADRTRAICEWVARTVRGDSRRNVIVLSKYRNHCEQMGVLIAELLRERPVPPAVPGMARSGVHVVMGGTSTSRKRKLAAGDGESDNDPDADADRTIEGARVISSTNGYAGEGFDVQRLNTLVLATPVKDVLQLVGRIMRGGSAATGTRPLVLDVVDPDNVTRRQAKERRMFYEANGMDVTTTELRPENPAGT